MAEISRLTCPYCRTLLNAGAFVCHGCGAVRGHRRPSFVAILLGFPVLAFAGALALLVLHGDPVWFFVTLLGGWLVMSILYARSSQTLEWARGAAAGGMVVEEARPFGRVESADDKTCPQCAETVKAAARVCRFCGYDFTEAARVIDVEATPVKPGS